MAIAKKTVVKKPAAKRKSRQPKTPGVFDVARPKQGAISVNATSKPVLVSNRPLMPDPMVTPVDDRQTAPVLQTHAKKIVIQPLHDDIAPEPPVENEAADTEAVLASSEEAETVVIKVRSDKPAVPAEPEPAAVEIVSEPDDASLPEPSIEAASEPVEAVPAELTDTSAPDEKPAGPYIAPQAPLLPTKPVHDVAGDDDPDATAKQMQARMKQLEQLVAEERYFLPINRVERQRSQRWAVIGLLVVILLAAAWYDVALDAGLVRNTYNVPHSRFFSVR